MNITKLSNCLEEFLALKRTMTKASPYYSDLALRQLNYREKLLRDFFAFWQEHGQPWPIRATFALDWITIGASCQHPHRDLNRLKALRAFLNQVRVFEPKTEIPENVFRTRFSRRTPHIFSDNQIEKLMKTVGQHPLRHTLLPRTLSTLIGLLASTGLRIGEAIRLKVEDVQLASNPPYLLIYLTKFGKSRQVVLHPSTAEHLQEYLIERAKTLRGQPAERFFINRFGRPLGYTSIHRSFQYLFKCADIQSLPGRRAPSLHCFRHSFAVKRLTQWHREGNCVQELLPHLAVYLGHTGPENTYWYITATPELLDTASALFDIHSRKGGANQ